MIWAIPQGLSSGSVETEQSMQGALYGTVRVEELAG